MKFLVIGLGSMGRRRIRLLQQISKSYQIAGVDGREDRRKKAEDDFSIRVYSNLEKALLDEQPQCAIVSTSPLSHADIIETCLKNGCHVFTELNLVNDKYESNIKLAQETGRVLFLSSTLLYRDEIYYIKNRVCQTKGKLNYNYHVGQYLPDWHPWESIHDYFVGDQRTNGCRELFAVELPWLINTFGEIESYKVLSDKNSDLPIQFHDNYFLLLKHVNGNKGFIAVDVISRKAVQNLEIFGENLYLTWDGTPTGLYEYDYNLQKENKIALYETVDRQEGYASFVIENAYKNELETFIKSINKDEIPKYTFSDDFEILKLIDQIEGENQ